MLLHAHAPGITKQLEALVESSATLRLWGQSRNFDEIAGREIVHPRLLSALWAFAGRPPPGEVVHAGLIHTYGYLFSTVRTPFGFKRTRWLRPTIARGLGLPAWTLSPEPKEGTLLGNLGAVLGRLVAEDGNTRIPRPRACAIVSEAAAEHPLPTQRSLGIRETVTHRNDSPCPELSLRSDLVPLLGTDQQLLVYAVGAPGKERLITAFTIAESMVTELGSLANGSCVSLRLRYNAACEGFGPQDELRGHRRVCT